MAGPPREGKPARSGRQRRRRSSKRVGALADAGLLACVASVGLAPLLAGGVHRGPVIGLITLGLVGMVCALVGLTAQHRTLRMGVAAIAPALLVAIPLLQVVPIPLGLRGLLDHNGNTLLQENQIVPLHAWPLSLDPPGTRADVGRAALALIAFLVAFHLASGNSRRHLVLRVIGGVGIAAVVIGLGHRILGVGRLYGVLEASARSLLVGPFVNANHTAELLELATFACLACSFQRPTALNRVGWLVGTLFCAGGATATLSRGAILGLVAGGGTFILLRQVAGRGDGPGAPRRRWLIWVVVGSALLLVLALALGADQVIERFKADTVSTDIRLRLWRESLRVLAAHPFGIGRDTFDRVFPIYRTLKTSFPLRFAFVENEPLQLLIDYGWFFFLLVVAAAVLIVVLIARRGRRDAIESALLAGVVAIVAHSTVDFGLETLGVLLPFAAITGAVLGRAHPQSVEAAAPAPLRRVTLGLAMLGAVFGAASVANASSDNFDVMLKKPMTFPQRKALLTRAELTHPLDYFYALEEARLQPLKGPPGDPSPRLHALNRALRLCPSCETVHVDVARSLWVLRLRRQALLEWRTAVDLQPALFEPALGELFGLGAKPEELAAVASANADRQLDLVYFLAAHQRIADAFVVLNQADAMGAPAAPSMIARATLQVSAGQQEAAAATLEAARHANIQDPRLAVLEARSLIALKGADAADQALGVLDTAATRYPSDLPVERERVDLVIRFQRWKAATRAVEGLKMALYHAHGSASEAHVVGARIQSRLGHPSAALDEYRVALADSPQDVSLWIEFGHTAEDAGHDATARDAYAQAARLSPSSPDVAASLRNLEGRQERLRALIEDGTRHSPGD